MEDTFAALFRDEKEHAYAVIDGAACEELLDKIDVFQPEYACLYTGELEDDIRECAPHLVALRPDNPFTSWFLSSCAGQHWGIFVLSTAGLRPLRKHFRTFLLVKNSVGETVYFRYYDPRVLTVFLPTCTPDEAKYLFGPVRAYGAETEEGISLTWFEQP